MCSLSAFVAVWTTGFTKTGFAAVAGAGATAAGTITGFKAVACEAEARVKSTYWIYIPKSEWKTQFKKEEPAVVVEVIEETISKKKLKRKNNLWSD